MKKVKVLLDFIKLSVPDLIEFARNFVTKTTGNTNFTTPDVPVAQVTTAVNVLESAYVAAQDGGRQKTELKRTARVALETLLYKEADYVERTAAGNVAVILSSGFNPTNEPKHADKPDFNVELGKSPGEVILTRKAIGGADAYIWQYSSASASDAPDSAWLLAGGSTKAKFTIKNLQSGVKYSFRVCGITKDGTTPWSNSIQKTVQ
ncbi:MAG: fibronectin type III domain-containing protein [Bacteroidales bacterium]|jgi:hypothetical protein